MIGLPLWVKYQQRAYLFYIIAPPCTRDSSFEILLEGKNCKIGLRCCRILGGEKRFRACFL
jgi:hypothetical protein